MPSIVATSRTSTFCVSAFAARGPARTIAKNSSVGTGESRLLERLVTIMFIHFPSLFLEPNQSQNPFRDWIRRARSFAHDSLAFNLDLEIADMIGGHRIGGIQVAGANQAAENYGFVLVVHCDLPLRLDDEGPRRQHCRHASRKRGAQRSLGSRLSFTCKGLA